VEVDREPKIYYL